MAVKDKFDKAKKSTQPARSSMMELFFWLHGVRDNPDTFAGSPIDVPGLNTLKVNPDWGPKPDTTGSRAQSPTARAPRHIPDDYEPAPVGEETWNEFLDHLLEREGYRNTVYRDSRGFPTVGVGHLVRPEDNLKVGDAISDERVRDLLEKDASKAYRAAIEQANELGINDAGFVKALGSVNFQLGTGWRQKFPQTWQHMKDGNYDQAIRNIENSLWSRQTPVRTADFTAAIERVASGDFNVAVAETGDNPDPGLNRGDAPDPHADKPEAPTANV